MSTNNRYVVYLSRSTNASKKFSVQVGGRTISFGSSGYEDFTIHGDEYRRQRYIDRHSARENWTKTGIKTAGFWSRWLLWNKKTLNASIKDIEKKFNVHIEILH